MKIFNRVLCSERRKLKVASKRRRVNIKVTDG